MKDKHIKIRINIIGEDKLKIPEVTILVGRKTQSIMDMVNMFIQMEKKKRDYLKMIHLNQMEMYHMIKKQNMHKSLKNQIILFNNDQYYK